MREVKVDLIKKVFNRLVEKLEYENVERVLIENDLYNKIPTHKWSIYHNPEDVVVIGSLDDDIESLEKLADDDERQCTYVDFDRFASLLRAISEIRNPVE